MRRRWPGRCPDPAGPRSLIGDELIEDELIEQARAGRPRAIARLISLAEDDHPAVPAALAELAASSSTGSRSAAVIGLTGPPGVGKSTTTSALIAGLRAQGRRVGVLAVDPSSPFSGGALLGDRMRMHEHALDPGVFIRSMATRGHLGGLARATGPALRVLEAAGFDVVLIETVGVGQSELEIAALADTTVVLVAPGMGDGVQAAKAGILEIADVLVVNRADQDGAAATVRDLRHLTNRPPAAGPGSWRPPVLATVATVGTGIDDLLSALEQHRAWLAAGTGLADRRSRRVAAEIEAIAFAGLRAQANQQLHPDQLNLDQLDADHLDPDQLDPDHLDADQLDADHLDPGRSDLVRRVLDGRLDPAAAARELLRAAGGAGVRTSPREPTK